MEERQIFMDAYRFTTQRERAKAAEKLQEFVESRKKTSELFEKANKEKKRRLQTQPGELSIYAF